MEIYLQYKPEGVLPMICPEKADSHETVHLGFAVDWSEEVNPLLASSG